MMRWQACRRLRIGPTLKKFSIGSVALTGEFTMADQAEKADPKVYPELKALYFKLKSKSGLETTAGKLRSQMT